MTINNFGGFLTDQCEKIPIKELLKRYKDELRNGLLKSDVLIQGIKVTITGSKTGNNGLRYWYECPICKGRCGVLFCYPLSLVVGCRTCLGLRYRKCSKKGMVDNLG